MDLIYADETRKDIGVLNSYDLDMAYGKDENDFSCAVEARDHCCGKDYFIYAENTEYGGIVDKIKSDTGKGEIKYMGRTWHGVLEGKVICPDEGDDYLVLSGDANEILQEIFDRIGLSNLFVASTEESVEITNYQFDRYVYAYTGICKFLQDNDLKLHLSWQNSMIVASAEPIYDYSQDEEFDPSQVDFAIERNYRPVNHIICLGQGDLKDRKVIHIFTDENGGIQNYLQDPDKDPVEDSDYILDTSGQVLFDQDEVMLIYDYASAEITTNYVKLTEMPEDWEDNCTAYFWYEPKAGAGDTDEGGSYKAVEFEKINYQLQKKQPYDWTEGYDDYYTYNSSTGQYAKVTGTMAYTLLSSKPGNWSTGYRKYYKRVNGVYTAVEPVSSTRYVRQTKCPSDWKQNYGNYFVYWSDGVTSEYRSVAGVSYNTYPMQTYRPSDWSTNFGQYFRRATARELKQNKRQTLKPVTRDKKGRVPAWKPKTYYTKITKQKAPAWTGVAKYTKVTTSVAPTWAANTYYQSKGQTAPTWAAGTYYTKVNLTVAPVWAAGKYFRQAIDHYAVMVEGAIKKLEEAWQSDKMDIDLAETDQVYDVGDIVGTVEQVTGISATQRVVKKVISIKNDDINISYEVG